MVVTRTERSAAWCLALFVFVLASQGNRAAAQRDLVGGEDTSADALAAPVPEREAPREAVELFQLARDHYQHGRYDQAASNLERALTMDPDSPTLLYNLARVYELSGEHEEALSIYRRYLRAIPESDRDERERTQAAIQRLEGARTQYHRADEDAYSRPIQIRQAGLIDEAFWGVVVTGIVLTVGAVALAATGYVLDQQNQRFRLGRDGTFDDYGSRVDTVQKLAISADIAGGAGALFFFTGAMLGIFRERTVQLDPNGGEPVRVALSPFYVGVDGRW